MNQSILRTFLSNLLISGLVLGTYIFFCSLEENTPVIYPNTVASGEVVSYPIEEFIDIAYDKDQNAHKKLNLILPKGKRNAPIFVWIGQGAWAYVDRNKEMDLCRKFAEKGIAVASIGHRLSPGLLMEPYTTEGVQHPAHVQDVAKAFQWVYEHAEEYGYDKQSIFIGGYSSGAHLSSLLTMDGRYLEALGLSKDLIKACISVSGGFDMEAYRNIMVLRDPSYQTKHIDVVFGKDPENLKDASPIQYYDQLTTPILIFSDAGTYDFNKSMEEKLIDQHYSDFQVIHVQNETHFSLWQKLSYDSDYIYRNFIIDYILGRSKKSLPSMK